MTRQMVAPGLHAAPIVDTAHSPSARLRPLDLSAVRLDDRFWGPRRAINRAVTLAQQYMQCEQTGRLDNFRRAAGRIGGPFQGRYFNDSDVYKWLEAAAWTLATDPDPALAARVDDLIALIAAAQETDGYLNTYFTFERAAERWTDLAVLHELYCAGHLIQAAVAHHRATGGDALLRVATRFADHIDATFGPGKRPGTSGHPEIEMALVELARTTGESRYLHLAWFFLDQRGQDPAVVGGEPYRQDHLPVRAQREVVGHAVRALYLYAGMADVYAETGERALWETLTALWDNLQRCKVYVTGGAGARHERESFGDDYELPNERAYAETCAAIAHVMWAWRMLLLTGEGRFADAMETALYNGVLSGLALDGTEYFYVNPLADRGAHRRQPWYGTACCPPNLARLLASLPGYVATTSPEGVWLHLYATGAVTALLDGGGSVALVQQSDYPWDGAVTVTVRATPDAEWGLFLRVPAWAEGATVRVNDEAQRTAAAGGYATIRRAWRAGDVVRLSLPMPARLVASHPRVANNRGRVAILRGPLVYCIEGADHPDTDVRDLELPPTAAWQAVWRPDLLGGVTTLHTVAIERRAKPSLPLYRAPDDRRPTAPRALTAIPYHVWANREPGAMQVWLPVADTAM